MLSSILLLAIITLSIIKNLTCEDFGIKLGNKIDICCSLKFNESNSLVLTRDSSRLASLYENKLIESDWAEFSNEFKDFKLYMRNNTICVAKDQATKMEENLKFKCSVIKGAFGKTIQNEILRIKIYEELKFVILPLNITEVATGNKASVKCSSTGSPDLKTLWRKENNEVVANGTSSSTLLIKNVTLSMDGNKYTCEASINVPKGTPNSTIQQTTTLDILFAPKMLVDLKSFQTDLGIKEVIQITVKGNPIPKLECRQLLIAADRIITIPTGIPKTYLYKIEFDNITLQHIGNYQCTAINNIGETKENITLILGPINLRITSTNETAYSDYYSLKWDVDSKSNVNLSKIFINQYNGSSDSASIQRVLEGKDLSPVTVKAGNTENNWRYSFSHHIMNLTSNTLYKISLQMCSKYQCIDAVNPVSVHIPIFNGKNNVPISELNAAQNSMLNNPNGRSMTRMPLKSLCVIGASVAVLAVVLH